MGKLGILGSRWGVDGASQIVESWAYLKGQHEKSYKSYNFLAWPQIIMYPNSLHLIFYKMLQLTCHVNDLSNQMQWLHLFNMFLNFKTCFKQKETFVLKIVFAFD